MPSNVVKTERDERLWRQAKQMAAKEGRAKDYKYIMGIFMRMKKHIGGGKKWQRPWRTKTASDIEISNSIIYGFLDEMEKQAGTSQQQRTSKGVLKQLGLTMAQIGAGVPAAAAVSRRIYYPIKDTMLNTLIRQGVEPQKALESAIGGSTLLSSMAAGTTGILTAALIKRLARPLMKDVRREQARIQKERAEKVLKSLD